MFRRKKGPTATEQNIPAYTNWVEFKADESEAQDGDDSVHGVEYNIFITPEQIDSHKAEA